MTGEADCFKNDRLLPILFCICIEKRFKKAIRNVSAIFTETFLPTGAVCLHRLCGGADNVT